MQEMDPTSTEIIAQWVRQLASPVIQEALRSGGQVEIRLFTHAGKVRKTPVVVLNAGPNAMV